MSGSDVVLVDSSGWLEYITGDDKAEAFGPYLQGGFHIILPTIVVYEVVKILLLRSREAEADLFLSEALRHQVVELTSTIALSAASSKVGHRLPKADALIYATARAYQAELITSDAHFSGLPGVTLI
jgi:predicted nucleic acid-binding protein